jgi:thymidine kinase
VTLSHARGLKTRCPQCIATLIFYTGRMDSGKQIVIEALKKHYDEAMAKAKQFRALAASRDTAEEGDLYLQQAQEEEAKARGYLKHAEILTNMEIRKRG